MKQWIGKIQDDVKTVSLTMLLVLNLFGIVMAVSAVATALVLLEVDGGFLYWDGHIGAGGALVFIYTVCIVIAVSMAVTMRTIFIHPMQKLVRSMNELAAGNFDVRIEQEKGYRPTEMRAFVDSFNKAAEQLGGTEILRKDFINNFSHEFKTPIVSINGFAELLLEDDEMPPEEQREYLTVIRDESRRLADLASNILMLNRIESQSILTDEVSFPLAEQLRQSILVTQQKWRNKALNFEGNRLHRQRGSAQGGLAQPAGQRRQVQPGGRDRGRDPLARKKRPDRDHHGPGRGDGRRNAGAYL